MAIYAPVYKSRQDRPGTLAHETRKRKRQQEENNDGTRGTLPDSSTTSITPPRTSTHPVNRADPYFVAGISREDNLPLYPFPHTPVKSAPSATVPLEDALAAFKPPLLAVKSEGKGQTSIKQRHLDNLTTILHQCMLRSDWQRASRTWGLLVRTEIRGRGVDIRRNGRWGIGAEILMRKPPSVITLPLPRPLHLEDTDMLDNSATEEAKLRTEPAPNASDEGFELARAYYERLILQYPHTPRTQRFINATAFYPALFNIWIYEVQARHQRVRSARSRRSASPQDDPSDSASDSAGDSRLESNCSTTQAELKEATLIAQRMDQVLSNPPYDGSIPLLKLRGMLGLWLADLHSDLGKPQRSSNRSIDASEMDEHHPAFSYEESMAMDRHRGMAQEEREKGVLMLRKVWDADASEKDVKRVLAAVG